MTPQAYGEERAHSKRLSLPFCKKDNFKDEGRRWRLLHKFLMWNEFYASKWRLTTVEFNGIVLQNRRNSITASILLYVSLSFNQELLDILSIYQSQRKVLTWWYKPSFNQNDRLVKPDIMSHLVCRLICDIKSYLKHQVTFWIVHQIVQHMYLVTNPLSSVYCVY